MTSFSNRSFVASGGSMRMGYPRYSGGSMGGGQISAMRAGSEYRDAGGSGVRISNASNTCSAGGGSPWRRPTLIWSIRSACSYSDQLSIR
ncbi:Keratin, type I cytoskeletal 50 kDa [Salmo salar]|uniref:Keratin, type I cytoskeletal 50 kDa n=1 Tax=Salmo salar TaxID=8030 RepID=B9EL67_SALSA|nr:Keratin, type I cytoskeletal 50 kDa [Salmo salar]ACM08264.1 Keratin, type I cytoskeletal 50 kDa [Salmo salar]|eukprot:NP_001139835.1 Keratin, type I cytoskeletal 50 kDa [Salmo salar]